MSYHDLLKNEFSSWEEFESAVRELDDKKAKGDVFEDFVYFYFKYNKNYYQLSEIYQEEDIPLKHRDKLKLEETDYGVDGVIVRDNGELVAYQVKFKSDRSPPSYRELSTFWTESEYADHRYTIANSYSLPESAEKKKDHSEILVDTFEDLDEGFFEDLCDFVINNEIPEKEKYEPRPYQKDILSDLVDGLKNNDRGKLIAACGTGKTIIALWTLEELGSKDVLFVVPSLALIKQTLREWSTQASDPFNYLCVCSDRTVAEDVEDSWDISLEEIDVPVTTEMEKIKDFLQEDYDNRRIVFSTYHSLDVIAEAMGKADNFEFNLSIFDEAHRTAGRSESGLFSLGLKDSKIQSNKRLFMTATERLVKPRVKSIAENKNIEVFSMDDEDIYGRKFAELPFGEAIEKDVISDYKIVVAGVTHSEIRELINDDVLLKSQLENEEIQSFSVNLAKQILLKKAFSDLSMKKLFSFHSSIDSAKKLAFGQNNEGIDLNYLLDTSRDIRSRGEIYIEHINGSMSAGRRRRIFDQFKISDIGVITNARALVEGVDVPKVDSIFFADAKGSLIDIVQATGRALRKKKGKKENIAYIIIPIFIPEDAEEGEIIESSNFETVFNVIQSMRDQDERLDSWINEINLKYARGDVGGGESVGEKIEVLLPEEIDINEFNKNLKTKIIEVNPEPEKKKYEVKEYGKGERKSEFKRKMKTVGDYSKDSYKNNLVDPTLEKFSNTKESLLYEKIQINHNNVSHTKRLGLISENEEKKYELTPLGKDYFKGKIDFNTLFETQMLKYFEFYDKDIGSLIYPYRSALKVLLEVRYVKKPEFVYGIYTIENSNEKSIRECINRIEYMRENYPKLEQLNEANKKEVLRHLNEKFGLDFSYDDVWSNRRTTYNQFLYFRDHLSTFDSITQTTDKISIIEGRKEKIRKKLDGTNEVLDILDDYEKTKEKLSEIYTSRLGYLII